MERKINSKSSKSLSTSPFLVKRIPPNVISRNRVLPPLLHDKNLLCPGPISKSSVCSPIGSRKISQHKSNLNITSYTDWEIFSANKETKTNIADLQLHKLRRGLKNPYIYSDNEKIETIQKSIETKLHEAILRIHKN